MLSFGLELLDAMFSGRDVTKAVILAEGPPGSGKEVLGYHFLNDGLRNHRLCIYVYPPNQTKEEIQGLLASYGMETKPITWFDTSGTAKAESDVIICDLSELHVLSIKLKQYVHEHKDTRIRMVFDVLNPALMTNRSVDIYNFFSQLAQEFKKYDVLGYFLVEDGMHDPKSIVALEQLADAVIETRFVEDKMDIAQVLRVKKMGGFSVPQKFFKFVITKTGIKFE